MSTPDTQSAVTTGAKFAHGVDGRSAMARRARDLVHSLSNDIGGDPSTAQLALIRRSAVLVVRLEQIESQLIAGGEFDLDRHQRASNTLRRLLMTLGLRRVPRDVTPDLRDYLAARTKDGGA